MQRILSRLALLLLLGTIGAFLFGNYLVVRRAFMPARLPVLDATSVLLRAEKVRFETSDGIEIHGSFLHGKEGAPAIVFCHDRGQNRASVLPVALLHNSIGYSVLTFDFRAHGDSGGRYCTLGVREREDVLAAVDYLRHRAYVRAESYGLWGMGMGAYAAFLAAPEAKGVKAVAAAFLYPDPHDMVRAEFERLFHSPMGLLQGTYDRIFDRIAGADASLYVPEKFVGAMGDRQVLLVEAANDPIGQALVEERLYPALGSLQRTLIEVSHREVPTAGSDKGGFELNTMQFFRIALPITEGAPIPRPGGG